MQSAMQQSYTYLDTAEASWLAPGEGSDCKLSEETRARGSCAWTVLLHHLSIVPPALQGQVGCCRERFV